MNNNTEPIPWLIYVGTRRDGQDAEGRDELGPAVAERGQDNQDEGGTDDEDQEPNYYRISIRRRHITRVRVDESVTAIRANAFMCCTELKEIQMPETVTSIGNLAFFSCRSLANIQIPCQLRTVERRAFLLCCSLSSIWLPDSVVSIGAHAFSACTALQSIRLPGGITSIESSAFAGCSALGTLEIPGSVISIGQLAFARCESLQIVRIPAPSSLSSIGTAAFARCPMLTEIDVGMMDVALWPLLFIQLGSHTGLFGHATGTRSRQRRSFVLSFIKRHVQLLFEGGSTMEGWSKKRGRLAVQN
jgi:hypothetical protein